MDYVPVQPHGRPIPADPHFSLRAGNDGTGFVHCGDGVVVVPLAADGRVLLAVEYSPAHDRELLVLPGGSTEPGEALEDTANRELQEELGWRASQMDYLGELYPFKYLTSRQFVFLARALAARRLDGDEIHPIGERAVCLEEALDLCLSGEIHDALTVAALGLAQRYLHGARHEDEA